MTNPPRWIASICYRRDDDTTEDWAFAFEELEELHNIVETGPDFYTIVNIVVFPSDRCPPTTIEKAMKA